MAGTVICSTTVSIQKVAVISAASALGFTLFSSPRRNAILAVPPPKSGSTGSPGAAGGTGRFVAISMVVVDVMFCFAARDRKIVFGSSRICWVMVPAVMNDFKSCGMRKV